MRILLTTPYDLAVPGGVNRHALGLFGALAERGFDVRLVGPASGSLGLADPRIVPIGRVRVAALNGAKSRVTLDLSIRGAIRRLIRSFQPEVVHLQEPFLPTLNSFTLEAAGDARRVGTFHTFSETSRGYLWAWPWCWWTNRQLDARIAVSFAARAFATRYQKVPMEVIPHGVDHVAANASRKDRRPEQPAHLLFVGRADEPRKGYAILLAALDRLERKYPGAFTLEAVGRGTPRGEVSEAELALAYGAADVCVIPSLGGESFGLVALEALSHGTPVIASRIAGYAEWLEEAGAARLVPPGDSAALADAIHLLCEPSHYDRAAVAAPQVATRYSWDACVERTLKVYQGTSS